MKLASRFVPLLLSLMVCGCVALLPTGERAEFVKVHGTHLTIGGKSYYFAGTNLWYGCYLGSPGETGDRPRLCRELDSLCSIGLTNLRVLAASEASYLKRSISPAIQRSPGDLNDSLLLGLDYLLAEMGRRHMRAVLFLNNYWQWSGGMAAYNVWAGAGKGPDPDVPSEGYPAFMKFSAEFYTNPKADSLFRLYVRTIVTRRNSFTGMEYREDPTIMAWQLANEPRPGMGGEEDVRAFCAWVDRSASYLHSLDTNHLVSTGNEGTVSTGWTEGPYLRAHASRQIDYLTFHLWPKNWGWFDARRAGETLPSTEQKALDYIDEHLMMARQLGKPTVMEEFGIPRDSEKCAPGTPTKARDEYYAKVLVVLYDSARAGAPVAGSNFWGWGGSAKVNGTGGEWRPGDPYVGDPPQEPQGLNSIFLSDTSTIRILRRHALLMNGLDPPLPSAPTSP